MTTHGCHKTQRVMTPSGFEPAIPKCERRPTYALDRAAAGIGLINVIY